mmetsp:Transcript_29379/g.57239  ORF Transcript_29379/g.57239 Transcript_29379/m.57239 type:complete len:147 (-) Transcript_29379:254-694(-)
MLTDARSINDVFSSTLNEEELFETGSLVAWEVDLVAPERVVKRSISAFPGASRRNTNEEETAAAAIETAGATIEIVATAIAAAAAAAAEGTEIASVIATGAEIETVIAIEIVAVVIVRESATAIVIGGAAGTNEMATESVGADAIE